MAIMPYRENDPWSSMVDMHNEMEKMLAPWFGRGYQSKLEKFAPYVDIWEDNENIYVDADLPGMEQKDVNVKMSGNSLIISAKKEQSKEEKKKNYYCCERYRGSFYRAIDLPSSVDASKIKAKYKDGVLRVNLPKKEEQKAKDITVDVE